MKRHTCTYTQKRFFLEWIFCGPNIYTWDLGTFSTSCWSYFLWPLKQNCPGEWLDQHISGAAAHSRACVHTVFAFYSLVLMVLKDLFISENTGHPSQQRGSSLRAVWPFYEDVKQYIQPGSPQLLDKCVIKHFNHFAGQSEIYLTLQTLTFDSSGILTLPTLRMHVTYGFGHLNHYCTIGKMHLIPRSPLLCSSKSSFQL